MSNTQEELSEVKDDSNTQEQEDTRDDSNSQEREENSEVNDDSNTQEQEEISKARDDSNTQEREETSEVKDDSNTQEQEEISKVRDDNNSQEREETSEVKDDSNTQEQEEISKARDDSNTQEREETSEVNDDSNTQDQEEISKARDGSNSQERKETSEVKDDSNTQEQEEISKARDDSNSQEREENSEVNDDSNSQEREETSEVKDDSNTQEQEEISKATDDSNSQEQEETGEVKDDSNTQEQEEISKARDDSNTQEEITEEKEDEKEITEENDDSDAQEENSEVNDDSNAKNEIGEGEDGSNTQQNDAIRIEATEDQVKKIFEELKEDRVSKIILTGEAGTGKTWMAKEICKYSVKENHGEPIWIYLDKKHDMGSLEDTIARQLALPTRADARFEDGEKEKKETREKKVEDKLKAASKFLLVVLDGQVEVITEKDKKDEIKIEDIMKLLGLKGDLGEKYKGKIKVLITRRKSEDGDSSNGSRKTYELGPLSKDEPLNLLRKNVGDTRVLKSPGFQNLSGAVNKQKPAEILILAKTLKLIAEDNFGELKHAFKEPNNGLPRLLRLLLRYTYDKEPHTNCMIDCFWHSWHFLRKHGGVHYNELITNWIVEGCLKPTNQIEKTYKKGHDILMTLIDRNMLKMQEDNVIVMEGATCKMEEYCRRAYSETADPGLASVLKDYNSKVLEEMAPADGMMKTLCDDKQEKMITSLLIDGVRLCREVHETFFGAKQNLELLAIFSPRLQSLEELFIAKMKKLIVLILRDSYLLKDVNGIENLKLLAVLEISGSTDLKTIPPELFHVASKLQSLDLSGAGIGLLPDTFSELTQLRRLILRQCSLLESLPKLKKLDKLEVIDLSGCENLGKIQEKSFGFLENLQVLNLSQTKIEKAPIVKTLRKLTILLLKGCRKLAGMRMLKEVSSLKVLDLSGAVSIKEIVYDCFDKADGLTELDLSETKIQYLPPDIGNLQKLRLKGCSLLKDLPELKGHKELEELELSGCTSLVKLPDLSALKKLKILGLENCNSLETLPVPDLKELSKLEKLDLRGTKVWSEDVVKSLSHITKLEILPSN